MAVHASRPDSAELAPMPSNPAEKVVLAAKLKADHSNDPLLSYHVA